MSDLAVIVAEIGKMLNLRPFWAPMNRTTIICLLAACLMSSCALQTVCPAYHSAFILDEYEQQETYSLFVEVGGTIVPKRPYGFKFKAEDGDSLMEKFIDGTSGKGFRVQKGRVHPHMKGGFTYDNWKKEGLLARVFRAKEKPVLENPYLFDKIFKKRPFYKLDTEEMEIVHFNRPRYDSIVASIVDTTRYRQLMAEFDSMPPPIQAQHAPLLRGSFNVEQEEYNRKFAGYFLRVVPRPEPEPVDSALIKQQLDSLANDSTKEKKGIFGLFKKKKKSDKEEKEDDNQPRPNDAATREEEEE